MNLKNIYSNFDQTLDSILNTKFSDSTATMDSSLANFNESRVGLESFNIQADTMQYPTEYNVQTTLRPLVGKTGQAQAIIGCHPDFKHLETQTKLEYGYSITLFMDIIGSTKLGIIYPPDKVFHIKNSIIRCAIETIQAFDGHVHRIMGDAVMAFFRSNRNMDENKITDNAIDALNCATFLIELFKSLVIPKLQQLGADENFGIRIGIDYGSHQEVIWGNYGYSGINEVTATSFFVDIAAKLQHDAPKNAIMLGQNFIQLLGLDDNFLKEKEIIEDGESKKDLIVKPNYKDIDGNPINYKKFIFKQDKYINHFLSQKNHQLQISATIKDDPKLPSEDKYLNCSRAIHKERGISFKADFTAEVNQHYKVKFRVVNTGNEAKQQENNGNHETFEIAREQSPGNYFCCHWEGTEYRGLHHMYVSVWDNEQCIIKEESFSIFIQ